MSALRQWAAPEATAPITATVVLPGSKSETNRALVLAALSSGPSVITGGLEARDTQLMRNALRTLGVDIVEGDGEWQITPPKAFAAGGAIDCGLAGTVIRFVPPIAALAGGTVRFDGDKQASARPMVNDEYTVSRDRLSGQSANGRYRNPAFGIGAAEATPR